MAVEPPSRPTRAPAAEGCGTVAFRSSELAYSSPLSHWHITSYSPPAGAGMQSP
jgi:hypothetical protein